MSAAADIRRAMATNGKAIGARLEAHPADNGSIIRALYREQARLARAYDATVPADPPLDQAMVAAARDYWTEVSRGEFAGFDLDPLTDQALVLKTFAAGTAWLAKWMLNGLEAADARAAHEAMRIARETGR